MIADTGTRHLEEDVSELKHDVGNLEQAMQVVTELVGQVSELQQQAATMQIGMTEIMKRSLCKHEPFFLDPKAGPVYVFAVADARAITVSGQPPPLVFALGICRKCWQTYLAVDELHKAEPAPPRPIKLVKPGEVTDA